MITVLMGGPADGRVLDMSDRDVVYVPIQANGGMAHDTYIGRKLATPDRWTQVVYVWDQLDLTAVTESQMIRAIMTIWRAKHRR